MNSNQSDSNTLPIYRLYFDDIEEIFLNTISLKYLFITTFVTSLLTIATVVILLFRSKTIFLNCLIPFIYSLVCYDFLQLFSILLLKYNLSNINEKYFSEFCRWPYYIKASSEAGQCLTLIFIYVIRCQQVRYFLKRQYLPNTSRIHSRALTLVCLLFIVYVNNWITHLKVEKIHVITLNEFHHEINIQEYPRTLYDTNDMKLTNHPQFYSDLDKYARRLQKSRTRSAKTEKIIHTQRDDAIRQVVIKIPYNNFFGQHKLSQANQTEWKLKNSRPVLNKTTSANNSYRIHRCTYGQSNFFLANFLSLIHSIIYLIILIYFLTTIYRYQIPHMTTDYLQSLHDKAISIGRRRSADRHKQLLLLANLRRFQYLIIYCHTTLIFIRLTYVCLLTITLCFIQSPFQWLTMRKFFYSSSCIVYYSIPLRIILLFLYLFLSLFSSYIHSIFYYIFHTKLHFAWQFQKPAIRFRFHIVQYDEKVNDCGKNSANALVLDLTSSCYDEHSMMYPNESMAVYEENSSSQHVVTTSSFAIITELQQSQL